MKFAFSCLVLAASGIAPVSAKDWALKIGVERPGAYAVSFEELGLSEPVKSKRLRLTRGGEAVPILVRDGGDGRFGPGDRLVFVGEHLSGEHSFFNPYSRENIYRLEERWRGSPRFETLGPGPATGALPAPIMERHLESDKLRVRFQRADPNVEIWYWHRMNQIDREPFAQTFDVGEVPGDITLRVALRGWSRPAASTTGDLADHRVDLYFDGELLDSVEFASQDEAIMEVAVPASLATGGEHTVELRVPKRRPEGVKNDIIDVVLVNYIQISHDFSGDRWQRAQFASGPDGARVHIPAQTILLTDDDVIEARDAPREAALRPNQHWTLVRNGDFLTPNSIRRDAPSDLTARRNRADYLMLTHHSLREAIEPLAEHHRSKGLAVEVIDVEDVYDEFNHGVVSPDAIRDFLSHAYHQWRERPQFVLLVGDASWDVHNDERRSEYYADIAYQGRQRGFANIPVTNYDEIIDRNLIPTFSVDTYDGHAASDNVFVAVDGDDFKPDMAIGRLPVVNPEEVASIVQKLITYDALADVGPWRRNILWITNEQAGFQRISDGLAMNLAESGFSSTKVYPKPEEEDNSEHQTFLSQAFDEGQLLVHFLGHGGRFIWRTGPPDFKKNHDLFTLDNIDSLAPTRRLPMILSMTCYSAPFDHPTADSIGEKFLRLPDRGAMAVFAASWRNSPGRRFSQHLVENLTIPGRTIGEAILLAKQQENSRIMVETYNLLGDPASTLALPHHRIAVSESREGPAITVQAELDFEAKGRFIVDWISAEGEVLHSDERPATDGTLVATYSETDSAPHSARVYFWDSAQNIDAFGAVSLAASADVAAEVPRPRERWQERRERRRQQAASAKGR